MTKDQLLYRQNRRCWTKRTFPTFELADQRRAKQNDDRLEVYACDICDGFHLGHQWITETRSKAAGQ